MRTAKKTKPNLQTKVYNWLSRLNTSQNLAESNGLPVEWSPLKKDKHNPPQAEISFVAPRVLLYLLAEKTLTAFFGQLDSDWLPALTGFSLNEAEEQHAGLLRPEIAVESLPDAWELATLQLAPQLASQKRHGAFYTSPELARKITAQTLGERASNTLVDPACGGGVFLLAALEFLIQQNPGCPPSQLLLNRIYGLDLNPVASGLTRLTLLHGLCQFDPNQTALEPALIYSLAHQIRTGNALVGEVGETKAEPAAAVWATEFAKPLTKTNYAEFEAVLAANREQLKKEIAQLPIFNHPEDGQKLAALAPFGWAQEFPEVFAEGGFSAVIGNPPYVGFNDYSGLEKAYYAHVYAPVYNLKNDLLYYFIKRGVDLLQPGGQLGFVTSRFWKEAVYAAPLRQWLTANCRLQAIEDLGRQQFFEDAEVDVCLLYLSRQPPGLEFPFSFAGSTEIIEQKSLGRAPWAWLRKLPAERLLLEKILEQSQPLGEIAQCRTGVQTGLDEVFFLTAEQARQLSLEESNLRPAIKNADVEVGKVSWRGLQLIYPAPDFCQEKYPLLWSYLEKHRSALEKRRRYDQPFPFYHLQWPREASVFESQFKLVTPYKAPRNTFGLDTNQYFFSTDVISLVFPPNWSRAQLSFARNFLNSQLSTFQFRSYGKLMSGGQWDYYANPVKKLAFPRLANLEQHSLTRPDLSHAEINELTCQLFNLAPAEKTLLGLA